MVRYGHEAVVRLLVENGDIDINDEENDGWSPRLIAARSEHEAVVRERWG